MKDLFGIPMDVLARVLLTLLGLILLGLVVIGWRNRLMVWLGLRNIPRRRAQTTLIVFGLMLGTLIVSAAFGTGDTMTYSFRALALDELGQVDEVVDANGASGMLNFSFGDEGESSSPRSSSQTFFYMATFENLQTELADLQAAGDARAQLVEAVTPVLQMNAVPVINRTGRQSEPQVSISGYDAATADAFDTLYALNGKRVTVAELGPNEAYVKAVTAAQLNAEPGHELEIYARGAPVRVTVKAVIKDGGLPGQLIVPLSQAQALAAQPGKINGIFVSNVGDADGGARYSVAVSGLLKRLLPDSNLGIQRVKQLTLMATELIGSVFTTMFVGFGSFSIAAAMLLIFLIFVMLAAERKQEMGMARAVGTRRRHLIQMFIFEGSAYDLVAAAVGALLGAAVGLATVGILANSFEGLGDLGTFQLRHHLEPRSVIVAYCLGVLLTFFTVAISSWRVSRLNIVAAIRDLPVPEQPDAGLRTLVRQPGHYLVDGLRSLFRLRLGRALKALLWKGPISTLVFFWALVGRGPLTLLVGLLSLWLGLGAENVFSFGLGVSLILIGIGLVMRWVLRWRHVRPAPRDRVAFSFAGITLLVFWSLPTDVLDSLNLPTQTTGPEIFVLSGVMMIAGAVWTIMYNADLLLGLVARLLSPFGSLLPVVRTAVAYPLSAKFRTGLTIAMFALVIFMLVFMSVFVHIFNRGAFQEEVAEVGDFDIEAAITVPGSARDLKAAIAAAPELNAADYLKVQRGQSRYLFLSGGSYFIKLADGIDARQAAQTLESALLDYGLETIVIKDYIQGQQAMINSIMGLLQAFMGLGLVVGSASIGIISTRAVVERRQQIGVLRSIGYRPWMIQWSFLLEASFVALVGILIGIGLGLILAYNFFNGEIAASNPGFEISFAIPWQTLGIIVAVSYLMSMLTTYLPSWQAARIYPAEALRYE